jgi:hypothetical protein
MLFSDFFSGKSNQGVKQNVLGFSSEVMAIFKIIDGLEILGNFKTVLKAATFNTRRFC